MPERAFIYQKREILNMILALVLLAISICFFLYEVYKILTQSMGKGFSFKFDFNPELDVSTQDLENRLLEVKGELSRVQEKVKAQGNLLRKIATKLEE